MNGYERRTELKKNKIRTAALELFCAYGTDKTSIGEIAEKAGVAPASIYNYFGSKEGLMKDTVMNLLESGWKARKELWETDLPFPELMKRAVSMSDDFIDNINLEALRALLDTDPEVKKLADDFYQHRYPDIVGKFIEKGRREGYIRRELSIEAATLYLRMYQNVIQQPDMLLNRNKDLLKELCDLMLYGLAGQSISEGS
ncbi:TetR/AcrR family transcriptional regulator [Sinanaerobacter chloroacetimidivorans]|uniref:TetR/AcrR family transcriptional regulator n=1 Tax=Sinanaerobacter chloroacetimidivorans TaxID=2818044 RepID=A0A8J7W2T7_9FIRM|nr:TetR/AcrR family transcriptional regulator [Sinanaerobacter chloroacetimidivorans]MBR0599346.1 TetR/AcrR family transcriptional regulator [Sinanaerobacter chloroacetimidivorans]